MGRLLLGFTIPKLGLSHCCELTAVLLKPE